MADEVQLPGIGGVDRRWVYAGAALVVGIVAYAWWQRSSAVAVDPVDAVTQEPAADSFSNPAPVRSTSVDLTTDQIRTNVQWTARVTEALGNLGFDSTYLANILGKYLSRQPLSLEEQAVVRTAWAYAGKPPEGPDNFTSPPPPPSNPPTNPPTNPPPVQGTLAAPTNVRQVGASRTHITVKFNLVSGATAYRIYGADGGVRDAGTGPELSVHGLSPNTTYGYYVTAVAPGKESSPSATVMVKTKA